MLSKGSEAQAWQHAIPYRGGQSWNASVQQAPLHDCQIALLVLCVRHDVSHLSHLAVSKDRLVSAASKELGTAMHLLLTFGHWAVQLPMTIALSVQAEYFLHRRP